MSSEIRVRIAPSPTGPLHIGTARTALFNWLFAKKYEGKFILRIEDTDLERSDPKYEEDIIESLKWLGLDWDEGPVRQTDRLDTYEKHINDLLERDQLYHCFCTEEELASERGALLSQGLAPKYSGKCRALTAEEVKERLGRGERSVLRLKSPKTSITFRDMIRGEVTFDTNLIGDIIIAKDKRTPLYNLAVVIDDEEMRISHVIRGEDHISNTPKQIIIQEALGFTRPKYAHLPLILDKNRSKLSKRYAATAIEKYRQQGYLPEAMLNFLLLLGWHPQDDKEVFTKEEMIIGFELERTQKGGAAFDSDKLNWINTQHIRKLSDSQLVEKIGIKPTEMNFKIATLFRDRLEKLSDFKELSGFFYELPDYPPQLLIWKDGDKENSKKYLEMIYQLGQGIAEDKIRALAERFGKGDVLWPLRVALSGKEGSPGPFDIIDILGVEETLKRIKLAIEKLG